MLRLLPTYTSSPLVRTRDQAVLETCHTVVDVGGEYDSSKNRFDHHQRSFNTSFPKRRTKLSSAGLIYMHFGKAIIAQHTKLPSDHPDIENLYSKLYDDFIEAIDANDNGVSKYDSMQLDKAGIDRRFSDFGVSLPSLVGDMNKEDPLNLDASSRSTAEQPQAEEDHRFGQASTLMGMAFMRKLHVAATSWLPARATVKEAFEARKKQHPSGFIMVLPRAGVPWKENLYECEEATGLADGEKVLYVLYSENEEPGSRWRVQAVPKTSGSFENRQPLPEAWRGLREQDLDALLGDDVENGAVFVHATGFIGGHRTEAGARAMAAKALKMQGLT